MPQPVPQNQPQSDDSTRVFIGLLLLALAAGLVLFVVAVFYGVATD